MLQEQASSIEDSPRIYTSKAGTPFSITLPYTEMLNQAGHASINRWFRQTSDRADNIYVSVELIELYYNNHTDVGSNQPIISVKLYISTKQGSSVVQEGTYESGQIKGEKFSMTFLVGTGSKFEEYFSRAAYRAILIAMDRAMEDVAQKIK